MEKSESIKELAAALAKAQGELSDPKAAASNPFFNSHYATLSMVLSVVRSVFSKNGLAISQPVGNYHDGLVDITTVIMHSSGEWMSSTMPFLVSKKDAQGIGSAITYGRRYMLAAAAGVAQDDDDGNAAMDLNVLLDAALNGARRKGLNVADLEKVVNAIKAGGNSLRAPGKPGGAVPPTNPAAPLNPNSGKGGESTAPAGPRLDACRECGIDLDPAVLDYSRRVWKRPLCRACQKRISDAFREADKAAKNADKK